MHGVFDLLGVCLALYVVYAAATGSVFAKHRAFRRAYDSRAGWKVLCEELAERPGRQGQDLDVGERRDGRGPHRQAPRRPGAADAEPRREPRLRA